jgi:predicted nucleic acid-binding protein
MTIMIDTNIILDVLGKREPFLKHSAKVLMLAAQKKFSACITANTITDIYYLTRKHIPDPEKIRIILLDLMDVLNVVDVTRTDCVKAFDLSMNDHEDALLARCAKRIKANFIVTRNPDDFINSPVPAIIPEDFLLSLKR